MMLDQRYSLLYRIYDERSVGARKTYPTEVLGKTALERHENSIRIIRYAFDHYLRWPVGAIRRKISLELLEKLNVRQLYSTYVKFPPEYSKQRDMYYLVDLAYGINDAEFEKATIHTYEALLSGTVKKFPPNWWTGEEGRNRAIICLTYALSNFLYDEDINSLYHMFSTTEGVAFLKKSIRLNAPCEDLYETPVDYLDETLADGVRDECLKFYYKYCYLDAKNGGCRSADGDDDGCKLDFQDY